MKQEFVKGLTVAAAGQLTKLSDLERVIAEIPLTKANSIRLIALARILEDKVKEAKGYLVNRCAATGSYIDSEAEIAITVRDKTRVTVTTDEIYRLSAEISAEERNVKEALKIAAKDKVLAKKIADAIARERKACSSPEEIAEFDTNRADEITHTMTVEFLRDTFPGADVKRTAYKEWTVKR